MSTLNKSSKEPWLNFFGVIISALIGVGGTVYIATRSQGKEDKPNTTIVVQTAPTSNAPSASDEKSSDEAPKNTAADTNPTPAADIKANKTDNAATPQETAPPATPADASAADAAATPASSGSDANANPNMPDGFTSITDAANQCPPETTVYNSLGHEAGVVKAYDATKGVSLLYSGKQTPTWISENVFKQMYFLKAS